jgi:hypothetical protein
MSQESKFRQALQRSRTLRILLWLASYGMVVGLSLVITDWIEYHTRGKSAFRGLNPRCTDRGVFRDYCFKLDTENMPWDAIAASWVFPGFLIVIGVFYAIMLGYCAVAAAGLAWTVFVRPKDRNTTIAHRLAHSPWIDNSPMACGFLVTAAVAVTLYWNGQVLLAWVALTIGAVASVWALFGASRFGQ